MYLKSLKLDHTAKKTSECFGLEKHITDKCHERIMYCVFKNKNIVFENYSDPEDAPQELTTRSGYLQKIFETIDNEIEYEYTLFVYEHKVTHASNTFDKYQLLMSGKTEGTEIEAIDRLAEMAGERAMKANKAAKENFIKHVKSLLACETFDEYFELTVRRAVAEELINHVFKKEEKD